MKSRYSLEQLQSIVPVECAGKKGTAFFISENQLLTARHVVTSALLNDKVDSKITFNNNPYFCDTKPLGNDGECVDVAILTLKDRISPAPYKFPLLSYIINEEWDICMVGYPSEIGNNQEQFTIKVSFEKTIKDDDGYDMLLRRDDPFLFIHYHGFSGSPILDTEGNVLGIVCAQNSQPLQGISIVSIKDFLDKNKIKYSEEGELADLTRTGLGRSVKLLKESIKRAGNRYQEDVYQEDVGLIQKVDNFLDYSKYLEFCDKFESAKEWASGKHSYIKSINTSKKISLSDLIQYLQKCIFHYNRPQKPTPSQRQEIEEAKKHLQTLKPYTNENPVNHQFFYIKGHAGYGKTSAACEIAKKYVSTHNVYLLFGSQFIDSSMSPIEQIYKLLGFEEDDFENLNSKVLSNRHYALFIIDAINEGASYNYWNSNLSQLISTFENYKHFKLIITIRDGSIDSELNKLLSKFISYDLVGFSDTSKAIKEYFKKYNIPDNIAEGKERFFSHPLLLSIVCQSFYNSWSFTSKSRLDLYITYLQKRNIDISKIVGEDEMRNVTTKFLLKLAHYSVFHNYCGDVSREEARLIADKVCKRELWSHNLLYATLSENLLLPVFINDYSNRFCGQDGVMFDFENLGDVLNAYALLTYKKNDDELMEFIRTQKKLIEINELNSSHKFENMLSALLGICKRRDIISRDDFLRTFGIDVIIESLQYHGLLNGSIQKWLLEDSDRYSIETIFNHFHCFDIGFVDEVKGRYKSLSMNERDTIVAVSANTLYENHTNDIDDICKQIKTYNHDEVQSLGIVLCWLLSSSHPEFRAIVIRKLMQLLENEQGLFSILNSIFKDIDDPYILQGLYAAVYGLSLKTRNSDLVDEIAKAIYETQYLKSQPTDLLVREWTLKTIERAHILNSQSPYWDKVKPPYKGTPNPMDWLEEVPKSIDEHYFGEDDGSKRIYNSIFSELDFDLYIIGTNSSIYSDQFYISNESKEDGYSPVLLEDIKKMIAYCIKHELGWNSNLGQYDKGKSSPNRFVNLEERIGKKYQWVAYYQVMALLGDHCKMKECSRSNNRKNFITPYPWNFKRQSYFDPTLVPFDELLSCCNLQFNKTELLDREELDGYMTSENIMHSKLFIIKDDKEKEWVLLVGSQKDINKSNRNSGFDMRIEVNSCFVKKEEANKFSQWAKNQNFHNQQMSEHVDGDGYLWNEYPHADSYKSKKYQSWFNNIKNCPQIMLSYKLQLQEDDLGLRDKNFLSLVFAPCEEMMESLNLFTAERGIVRSCDDNEIIAINREQFIDEYSGLFVRKDLLLKFMNKRGYSLFFYVWGEEKSAAGKNGIVELSGCYQFTKDGEIDAVQKLSATT